MSEGPEGQGSSRQTIHPADVAVEKAIASASKFSAASINLMAAAQPRHLRWCIVVVWLAFIVAFLYSDFFVVAHNAGLYAAFETGSILGPVHKVTILPPCAYSVYNPVSDCGVYEDVPSFRVSLKLIFIISVISSAGFLFFASERARQSQKD